MSLGLTDAIAAESRPRVLAALLRSFRDLDLAEDLFQEACLRAAVRWQSNGVPDDPTAWLIRVARNAGLDHLRKDKRLSFGDIETALDMQPPPGDVQTETAEALDLSCYRDDVLRLMFLCCHPDLPVPDQLALALKVIAGLSVPEIARAFVVTPDTMQRRLSRAKERASKLHITLSAPGLAERAARLNAVQTVIYLLFNEGYSAAQGETQIRQDLCEEAIRLARLLLGLFSAQAELMGLLALCLLHSARAQARVDANGALVALEDQDRSLWDVPRINEGCVLVEKALLHGRPGPMQVQAAIVAMHCTAKRAEDTDWKEIVRLYEALEILTPGPVVRLNKAVAWSKLHGAKAALALLEPIAKELSRYQPYHAVRAALLEEVGDVPATIAALNAALSCTPTRQEAEYLMQRLAALGRN